MSIVFRATLLATLLMTPPVVAPAQSTAVVIETLSAWDGETSVIGLESTSGVRSLGQTVVAPDASAVWLRSFSFFLSGPYTEALRFRPYVMAWDEVAFRPTGPVLWRGAVTAGPPTTPGSPSRPFFRSDFFLPGLGLPLMSGSPYLLFLSTSDVASVGSPASAALGLVRLEGAENAYPAGRFVYLGTFARDEPPPFPTGDSWNQLRNDDIYSMDLAFAAEFAVVPEPSSMSLLAAGGLALACLSRRRRRRRAAA